LVSTQTRRVVRIRFGNLEMRDFHALMRRQWPNILALYVEQR
jgi:hypothetical protein